MDEPFLDPEIPDGESVAYRGLIGGRESGAGVATVAHTDVDGRPAYRLLLDFQVRDELDYRGEITFRRRGGTLRAHSYRLDTSHGGASVASEAGSFEGVGALRFGGEVQPYPPAISPLLGCAIALRGLEFSAGSERTFAVWLANTVFWEIHTKVDRIEKVTIPAGTVRGWRVSVRPSFEAVNSALDRIVGVFLPPFRLHFGADPPHPVLRFSFPTGPFPWNPRGLIEATDLPDA